MSRGGVSGLICRVSVCFNKFVLLASSHRHSSPHALHRKNAGRFKISETFFKETDNDELQLDEEGVL